MSSPRMRRAELPPGDCLCNYCTALCCRYFTLPIDTPTDWRDFDHIRWFLMHGRATVFVESGIWYLTVYAECRHLLPDQRCGIYDDRPQICRNYSTDSCEYEDDGVHDMYFETPEQIWEYAHAVLPPQQPRQFSPQPADPREVTLPLISAAG